ncbi:hypothetical protein RS130_23355 [Paraglaciecola aquimarina]|uniref:Uncharacterized protein n=1 Tax=Paraglaciecola aquimarina TaxID=1235557 RepID=A0ABU3T2F0_9ALTE|nr:hypothetical protein [Paraglaciecola aquimarina]MDU0356444.1 hypothetical protein [Paraglaciecola aquimarina]
MSTIGKFLMFSALICLAILCAFVGSVTGAIAFITLGILLEVAFWLGVFSRKKEPHHK